MIPLIMKLTRDGYSSYIRIKEDFKKPLKTKEIGAGVYADYDADDELVGIEVMGTIEVEDDK
jgi:uncharacterized protein YuzE